MVIIPYEKPKKFALKGPCENHICDLVQTIAYYFFNKLNTNF